MPFTFPINTDSKFKPIWFPNILVEHIFGKTLCTNFAVLQKNMVLGSSLGSCMLNGYFKRTYARAFLLLSPHCTRIPRNDPYWLSRNPGIRWECHHQLAVGGVQPFSCKHGPRQIVRETRKIISSALIRPQQRQCGVGYSIMCKMPWQVCHLTLPVLHHIMRHVP